MIIYKHKEKQKVKHFGGRFKMTKIEKANAHHKVHHASSTLASLASNQYACKVIPDKRNQKRKMDVKRELKRWV